MAHPFESQVRTASVGFALAALSTAAAVHAQPTQPHTLYVDASAPPAGNGLLWTSALRDIQDAIFIANLRLDKHQPVEIRVAQGIYTPDSGTFDRFRMFTLNSGVSLMGGFAGLASANPNDNNPGAFISVLSGDLAHNDGPGISTRADNSLGLLALRAQCGPIDGFNFRGSSAAIVSGGTDWVSISRCTITDNISIGSYYVNSLTLGATLSLYRAVLTDCVIADNTSTVNQIIHADTCTFLRCTIAGNVFSKMAPGYYGPQLAQFAGGSLQTCLLIANTSTDDSFLFSTYCSVRNCTIADNIAASAPGFRASVADITNCVVSRNTSTSPTLPQHQITLDGITYFRSGFVDRGPQDILPAGYLLLTGLVSGNPHFVNPSGSDANPLAWRDNNYQLAAGSPCIDHADASSSAYVSPYTDFLGHSPQDDPSTPNTGLGFYSYIDLGAYEFIPNPCRADFNNSGALSPQDIFDFLNAWFALNPGADFNGSGTITAQDIFDFLNAWFAGC